MTVILSRQVFCAAEGRALVTYDTESDANAGLSPRSRHVVLGARSLWTGRNTAELEVRNEGYRLIKCVLPWGWGWRVVACPLVNIGWMWQTSPDFGTVQSSKLNRHLHLILYLL